jgi:hypothetical protein
MAKRKKLTEDTLRELTQAYIDQAAVFLDQEISERREKALRYYEGANPDGLPVNAGRSKIVDPVVRDTVEWVMPSLMRIFTAGDKWNSLQPQGPEDAQKARAAEAWVSHVITRENNGYLADYQWIRDALIEAVGWQKIWWDVKEFVERHRFEGVTAAEVQVIAAQPGVRMDEVTEQPGGDGMPLYTVAVTLERRKATLRLATIPPEEVLYTEDATLDRESWWFVAHKTEKRLDELRALGFDVADDIHGPEIESLDNDERLSDTLGNELGDDDTVAGVDPGARRVWLYECYMRHDADNDGIAEWLQVMRVGDTILSVEEVDEPPLVCITPIFRSHRLTGYSLADLTTDLQELMTALHRSINDHLYLTVNPRAELVTTGITEHTVGDLLDNRAGGFVRVRAPGTVLPLQVSPLPMHALPLIEHWQQKLEARTGVTRFNAGLSPDTLNKTATGTALVQNAANQRIELIARNLAETGFRDRINLILRLSAKHPEYLAERTVLLSGVPLTLTADDLSGSYDIVVNTAVGSGNRAEQAAHMQTLLQSYQMLQAAGAGIGSQNPLFSTVNLYNALSEVLKLAGYRNTADFLIDPQNPNAPRDPPAPPQPSVEQVLAQVETQKAQVQAMKAQAEAQSASQKAALDAQAAQLEAQIKAAEIRIAEQELLLKERELALEEYKARAEVNARLMEAQASSDEKSVSSVVDFERELFDRGLREREMALKERQMQMQAPEQEASDDDEEEMKPMAAVLAALESLQQQLNAPKRVVRDGDGKVIGVETVQAKQAASN